MLSINNHSHEIPAKKSCLLEYELSKPEVRKAANLKKRFNKKFKLTGKETHICHVHGELPITDFSLTKNKYGKYYAHNYCRECEKTRHKPRSKKQSRPRDKNKVKTWLRHSQSNATKGLADSYIKRLLGTKLQGLSDDQKAIVISAKRAEILKLRLHLEEIRNNSKSINAQRSARHINELRDWYVRGLIQNSVKYDGHEITDDEIIAKRIEVIASRKGIIKKNNGHLAKPPKTHEEIRDLNRKKSQMHAANLTKTYLNSLIRNSKEYLGGEINDTQREVKRKEILARRESIANGDTKKTLAERITDSYIIGMIRNSKKYDGRTITKQLIEETRNRIIKKREKNNRILKLKKGKP